MTEYPTQPNDELKGWRQAVQDTSQHPELHAIAKSYLERIESKLEISPEHHQTHIDIARPAVPNIDSLPSEEQDFIGEVIEIGEEALSDHVQAPAEARETQEFDSQLPTAEELSTILSAELSLTVPSHARFAKSDERPNVRIINFDNTEIDVASPDLLPELQSDYIEQNTKNLVDKAWWLRLQKSLSKEGTPQSINILVKHTLEVTTRNKDTEQQYDIFEVGDTPLAEKELETVFATLKLIDQFSSGLLGTENARKPIVFGDISLPVMTVAKNGDNLSPTGINTEDYTYIDIGSIRDKSEALGVSTDDRLAGVIIHEVLGHHLERTVEGHIGDTFQEYFDYSEERKEGAIFGDIHESIEPKDPTIESNPMREYGHRNAAEDLATSVEASVSEALGWKVEGTLRDFATVDSYRRDIILDLMQAAAEKAKSHEGTPGFVGSKIEYAKDGTGNVRIEPVRQYEIRATHGEDARREEIAKLTARLKEASELIVRVDEPIY